MDKLFAPLLARLPAFALPFVTRSLRGGQGRRYLLISVLLGIMSVLLGLWSGLSDGLAAQGVRTDLGVEIYEWDRQQQEFAVYVHDDYEHDFARQTADRLRERGLNFDEPRHHEVAQLVDSGYAKAMAAAGSPDGTASEEHERLRERAQAFIMAKPQPSGVSDHDRGGWSGWSDPAAVASLAQLLDAEGVPAIHRYESPLGLRGALGIVGFFAGLLLAACVTVLGPLLVAVAQAQERHENTLMPLTGTSLTPRELALGLVSGPSSIIAIIALPQLVLVLGAAVVAGKLLIGLALLGALAAAGLFVTLAAQLFGHIVGQRRTPGMVGVGLVAMLGFAWLLGASFVGEAQRGHLDIAGVGALLPTFGLASLLTETCLGLPPPPYFNDLLLAAAANSAALLVFSALLLTVLARTIEGRQGPLLSPRAALVGVLTCITLVHVALPWTNFEAELIHWYVGLGLLALPLALLLIARVPIGDNPPRMRGIPLPKLLAEFAGWVALHMLSTLVLFSLIGEPPMPDHYYGEPPSLANLGAMLWIAWCVGVLGLLAIRLVAVPATIGGLLWAGCCALGLVFGAGQAVYCAIERHASAIDMIALSGVSPGLGLVQVIMALAIPISLVQHLRKNLGSVTGAKPSIPTESR